MLKRIIAGSISDAQWYRPEPGERYAVLSLLDVGVEVPPLQRHAGFVERLVVHADDCTPYSAQAAFGAQTLCPLSEQQAKQVARFVRANRERIETLVVHCHAGMSRSPGAAIAIAEALAIAQVEMINGDEVVPNAHVLELVRAAFER